MILRALTEKDVRRVADLERLCNPQPWFESSIKSFADPSTTLPKRLGWVVGRGDDSVDGYVGVVVTGGEAEILIVGVDPVQRRRGLGRNLLSGCCSELKAQNVETVFLELRRGNAPAHALYQSSGFRETGVRKAYYAEPREDAVQMRKDL